MRLPEEHLKSLGALVLVPISESEMRLARNQLIPETATGHPGIRVLGKPLNESVR